jgi:8-oxo-dGTP pyrophosphatase MutT (NUDIX family)
VTAHVNLGAAASASVRLTSPDTRVSSAGMMRNVVGAGQDYPVSVKGVVLRGAEVLLLRNERDEWELPGGRLERGESPRECVAREVTEEVGWSVEAGPLLDAWVYRIESAGRDVLILTYACREHDDVPRAVPQVSHEHRQARLFHVDDLGELPMPEGYRRSIRGWWRATAPGEPGAVLPW